MASRLWGAGTFIKYEGFVFVVVANSTYAGCPAGKLKVWNGDADPDTDMPVLMTIDDADTLEVIMMPGQAKFDTPRGGGFHYR